MLWLKIASRLQSKMLDVRIVSFKRRPNFNWLATIQFSVYHLRWKRVALLKVSSLNHYALLTNLLVVQLDTFGVCDLCQTVANAYIGFASLHWSIWSIYIESEITLHHFEFDQLMNSRTNKPENHFWMEVCRNQSNTIVHYV